MFSRIFRQTQSATLGLEFLPEGFAVAEVHTDSQTPQLDFIACEGAEQCKARLKDWVVQRKLNNASVNVVLSAGHYQMLLVEPPDVPAEELRHAVRWRLKDLLTMPVDQAVIEVFALPEDGLRGNKKMVYVVAAERKRIEDIIALTDAAGLNLSAIDISELAIRNIAMAVLDEALRERGVAVARLGQGSGSVFLYRQGNLYLARNFRLDYKGGLLDDLPEEALALELQRSVDYYERQMGQAPPAAVFLCGDNVMADKIGTVLRSSFAVPVKVLVPEMARNIEAASVQQCLGALGAALRIEVA